RQTVKPLPPTYKFRSIPTLNGLYTKFGSDPGMDGLPPIVLYEYQPGRSGEYPKKFLEGFHGYLHTDGYAGYNQVPDITRCGCWAHLRRKFVEAMPAASSNPKGLL